MPADFIIGAAIGAAVASERVRRAVRQGLVYGVGGALRVCDRLAAGAHAVAQGAREAASAAKEGDAAPTNGNPETAPSASPAHRPVEASPSGGTTS
jgi:hypothetical protein